jgi:hypothetical protein
MYDKGLLLRRMNDHIHHIISTVLYEDFNTKLIVGYNISIVVFNHVFVPILDNVCDCIKTGIEKSIK